MTSRTAHKNKELSLGPRTLEKMASDILKNDHILPSQ